MNSVKLLGYLKDLEIQRAQIDGAIQLLKQLIEESEKEENNVAPTTQEAEPVV